MTDLVERREAESRRHSRNQGRSEFLTNSLATGVRKLFTKSSGSVPRGGAATGTGSVHPGGWHTSAPTEFELGRVLMGLGSEWTVLSAADVFGDLDTDFVVVGPAGIFLISARVRVGANVWADENVMFVNGRPTNRVRDVRLSAARASERLSAAIGTQVRAIPVIALVDPHSLSFGGDPANRVVTLPAESVASWLSECSRTYSGETVAFFAMVAEDRATWGSLPNDSGRLARVR
jgi:hypothetical protein